MKILVTGFDPFGGESINPSIEAVKRLPKVILEAQVCVLELPTVFRKSRDQLIAAIDEIKPDFVICVGQAGGRSQITFERIAVNLDDAAIKDNEGNMPIDEAIDSSGPAAYFSTLAIKAMTESLRNNHIPAAVSNTAGTYVCNHVMYSALHYAQQASHTYRAGFIHIPYLLEQVVLKPGVPGMPLDLIVKGLELAIEATIQSKEDLLVSGGLVC